jgi:ribosomal protein L37AE/L43A
MALETDSDNQCPKCRSEDIQAEDGGLRVCENCGLRWQA